MLKATANGTTRRIVQVYTYTCERGLPLFETVRYEPKDFRQRQPDGCGGYIYNLQGVRRVLYRLADLYNSPRDVLVFVVEGEKDADRLAELGQLATSAPMGAKAAWLPEYTEELENRPVAIIADNDDAGREHAEKVAAALKGRALWVKVLNLSGLPPKGDVSDWLDAGNSIDDLYAQVDATPMASEREPFPEEPPNEPEQKPEPAPFNFSRIDTVEFFAATYETEYHIEDLLPADQSVILGGGKKNLKTNLLVGAGISMASGTPFLGKFAVPKPINVGIISVESGEAVLQETARRIAKAYSIEPEQLRGLKWCFERPNMGNALHLDALRRFIEEDELKVLAIDPAYLTLPVGDDAGNLFTVGQYLAPLSELTTKMKCTVAIAHHTKKSVVDPFAPPELEDIAWAGFQEWARAWVLLSRRQKYDPDSPGEHKLWMSAGGSAGHSSLWGLDIYEGSRKDPGGRYWSCHVHSASVVREHAIEEQERQKVEVKQQKASAKIEEHRKAILRELNANPEGLSRTTLSETTGMNPSAVATAVTSLLESGDVARCTLTVPCGSGSGKRAIGAIRLAHPDTRTNTPGHGESG